MRHGSHDLARPNAWATQQVLTYCEGLDEATLNAAVPGTYGTIHETLRHIINAAEVAGVQRLTRAGVACLGS